MKGSFTVELSLIFPVILMILIVFIQMGLYFTYRVYTLCAINQSLTVYSRARQEKKTAEEASELAKGYLYDVLNLLPIDIQDVQCESNAGWLKEECVMGVKAGYSYIFDMSWSSVGKCDATNPVSFRNRLDFIWEKGKQYLDRFQNDS